MNILILEDELIISYEIIQILKDFGYENFYTAINYTEAVEQSEKVKPDIAIIDINLSGNKTGIDFANYLNKNGATPFIYLTSNTDKSTIDIALKTKPNAYLPKPINRASIYSALEIAISGLSEKASPIIKFTDSLFIREKDMFVKVPVNDVIYLKGVGNYTEVFTKQKKFTLRTSIGGILDNNLKEIFLRTHKSYIINIKHVQSFNLNKIIMSDTIEVPISKLYRNDVSTTFQKML